MKNGIKVKTIVRRFKVDAAQQVMTELDTIINRTPEEKLKGEIVSVQDNVVPIFEGSLTTVTGFMMIRTLSIKELKT